MFHTGQDQASLDFGSCDIHGDCSAGVTVEMCLFLEQPASGECVEDLGTTGPVRVRIGIKDCKSSKWKEA